MKGDGLHAGLSFARRPAPFILAWLSFASPLLAQDTRQSGLGWSFLPALNYDSDEGYGYGIAAGLYQYGDGSRDPYLWSIEPVVFFTSNGRRSVSAFFDAPYLINDGVRLTAWVGYERDCCQPYYGFGNASAYDPALVDRPGLPNYYSYNGKRGFGVADLQWRLAPHLRFLTGFAVSHDITAARDAQTLFAENAVNGVIPAADSAYTSLGPKVGVIFDTRDFERDPRSGVWMDALVWQGLNLFGGDGSFTRLSGIVRGYYSPRESITFAARLIGESVRGDMPQPMLNSVASRSRTRQRQRQGPDRRCRWILRLRLRRRHRRRLRPQVAVECRRRDRSWPGRPGCSSSLSS